MPLDERNQPGARIRHLEVARFVDVAGKEVPGQAERSDDILGPRHASMLRLDQKCRQAEQTIAVGLAGGDADRAAAPRRDIGEMLVEAGSGAFLEVEAETEIVEKL